MVIWHRPGAYRFNSGRLTSTPLPRGRELQGLKHLLRMHFPFACGAFAFALFAFALNAQRAGARALHPPVCAQRRTEAHSLS